MIQGKVAKMNFAIDLDETIFLGILFARYTWGIFESLYVV